MSEYSDEKLKEYFKRSYFAVDGLWFMKTEEEYDFDTALEMDRKVWMILPKIQARKARELLKIKGNGIEELFKALDLKLSAEEYEFHIDRLDKKKGVLEITSCPWIKLLKNSDRGHLCELISGVICSTEFGVWASEFGKDIIFEQERGECLAKGHCKLIFRL